MKLNEGIIGHTYRVEGVAVNETITRRLEALGVNSMTPVTLLNKKGSGSVIFKVRGTRLAVGKRISDGIDNALGTIRKGGIDFTYYKDSKTNTIYLR